MSRDLYENVGFHDAGTPFYIPDFFVASLPLDKKEEGLAPKKISDRTSGKFLGP